MRKEREDFSPMQVEEIPAENYKLTEVMDKKKNLSKHPCLFLPELWVKIMSNHSPRLAQVGCLALRSAGSKKPHAKKLTYNDPVSKSIWQKQR